MKDSIIKDINLAEDGKKRIEWVRGRMPVLDMIRSRYEREKPLENVNVMACLHVTVETANLILTLRAGGAEVALTAANPLSTQDDIAAALASFGVRTYAYRGESDSEYYDYLKYALEIEPTVVLDDGADAITTLHTMGEKTRKNVMGTCEETTTGVIRHQARAKENKLGFPVIAVNNAETKMMFDNPCRQSASGRRIWLVWTRCGVESQRAWIERNSSGSEPAESTGGCYGWVQSDANARSVENR
jgi:adenosylhomocysteinase